MSAAQAAMLKELEQALPYNSIPAGAVTVAQAAAARGLTVKVMRDRLDDLVAAGTWQKVKNGNTCWYWKA